MLIYPLQDKTVTDFTIDMRVMFTDKTKLTYFVSGANNRGSNTLLAGMTGIWTLNGNIFKPPDLVKNLKLNKFYRYTLTRKGRTMRMYWDGKLHYENNRVHRRSVPRGTYWLLGQDQDRKGGGFDSSQRFIGKMCNFQMWDVGLNKNQMTDFFKNPKKSSIGKPKLFDNPPSYEYELKDGASKEEQTGDFKIVVIQCNILYIYVCECDLPLY